MNNLKKYRKILLMIFAIGLLINLVWEISHSFLYSCALTFKEHIPMILRATVWDAGYIIFVYLMLAFLKEDYKWVNKTNKRDVVLILFIGFLTSSIVELHALYTNKWSYKEIMPLIPYLKVGLTPFLQLALTSLATFWVFTLTKVQK
jgi:hypothetical protein